MTDQTPPTAVTWRIELSQGAETAWVHLEDGSLRARGRAFGLDPEPYWLVYTLRTGRDWTTRALHVQLETGTQRRVLDLLRHRDGSWSANGAQVEGVTGALDCDLGRSPLTNTMPILRHDLHLRPGAHEFVMAWVRVPDLTVHRSEQRYEHVRPGLVRYEGRHRGFEGELAVGGEGLLDHYPGLGSRIA